MLAAVGEMHGGRPEFYNLSVRTKVKFPGPAPGAVEEMR